MGRLFFACVIIALSTFAVSVSSAEPRLGDRDAALLHHLDSRADSLRRQIRPGLKVGALERQEIRSEIREIRTVRDEIAAGAQPDPQQIARLLGETPARDPLSPDRLASRADGRLEVQQRRLVSRHRIGALERVRIRSDIADLNRLIADVEAGRDVELARVDDLLNVPVPREPLTAEEKRRELDIQRATMKRSLASGSRIGSLERSKIRSEIDSIDAMISVLERQR